MATVAEELKPDSTPDFKPLGSEEDGGLSARIRARMSRGRQEPPPPKPKASTGPSGAAKKVTGAGKSIHDKRAKKITSLVSSVALGLSVASLARPHSHWEVKDGVRIRVPDDLYMRDAKAINDGAALVGETWASWADQNPKLGEWIDKLSAGGAAGMAIASLFAIAIPIAVNHNIVPEALGSQFTPAAIQALMERMKAEEEQED